MTSIPERRRAIAEISSFIARVKREREEEQEQLAYQSHLTNGGSGYAPGVTAPPQITGTGNGFASDYSSSHSSIPSPQRGHLGRGRGGRYEPYPSHKTYGKPLFKNKSVTFSKGESSDDSLGADETVTLTKVKRDDQQQAKNQTLCAAFTMTGICSRYGCRHLHDPKKLAVCKSWFFKGDCPDGDSCSLSHEMSEHNVSHCLHFQKGRCNNDECRFSHVRVNPAALNCEAFGRLGYCEKGADCCELHAHECPFFANTGMCYFGDKCRLGHVLRASRLKKTALRSSESPTSPSDSANKDLDVAAKAKIGVGAEKTQTAEDAHHFSQQVDFVPLDSDD